MAVASNNLAVLNGDQNLFDSRKRIKAASAPETEPKLNPFQKKIVQLNEALLAIYTGQVRSFSLGIDQHEHVLHDFSMTRLDEFSKNSSPNQKIPMKPFH
jgi:hypothetical protein